MAGFDVDVKLTVSPETADFAVKILNLYFKENDQVRPIIIEEVDNPANLPRKTVSLIAIDNIDREIPEGADVGHWETQYFDNRPFLFHCSKCGFVDSAKRPECGGCHSFMTIN